MLAVDPSKLPIRRHIRGKKVRYIWSERRETVGEARLVARLNALAVPPAWEPAFFAASGRCKVQALAIDGSGKEQTIYANWFREKRETDKFADLWAFGAVLPRLRRRAIETLRAPDIDPFDQAIAACVLAIDEGALRVGSRTYRQLNGTVGAVSLQGRHLTMSKRQALLHFTAKGGKERRVRLRQPDLIAYLQGLKRKADEDLFSVPTSEGVRHVRPNHVRAWLGRQATPLAEAELRLNPFTAKSFRLWHATTEALSHEQLAQADVTIKAMSAAAADRLGNTPTVARNSYIHPALFDGGLAAKRREIWEIARGAPYLSKADCALLHLLR